MSLTLTLAHQIQQFQQQIQFPSLDMQKALVVCNISATPLLTVFLMQKKIPLCFSAYCLPNCLEKAFHLLFIHVRGSCSEPSAETQQALNEAAAPGVTGKQLPLVTNTHRFTLLYEHLKLTPPWLFLTA